MGKQKTIRMNWDEIGISNDFLFGKIMRDPELCKELIQRILPNLDIDYIEFPETQKSIKPDLDARSVRLDVYIKDNNHTVYDIEMQATDTKELPKRSRYYSSMLDLQMLDQGQTYKKLNHSYIIFICLTDIFRKGRHMYTFEYICKENHGITLQDGTTKIFLNANGKMNDVSKELEAFLLYVAGKNSDDAYVKKLDKAVKEAKRNREWRMEYMTLLMRDQENIEQGIEQGIKQGIKQGIICAIIMCRDLNLSDEVILLKLQEKFNLTEEEAKEYMNEV